MFEEKNTTFFDRITQIIDFYGIKSINSFAKEYLKYDSSEKINRLKDEKKRPSIEILEDISNKFEDIDANWLLTGRGKMLRNGINQSIIGDQNTQTGNNNSIIGSNVGGNGNTVHTLNSDVNNDNSKSYIEIIKKQQEQIGKLIEVINKLSDK